MSNYPVNNGVNGNLKIKENIQRKLTELQEYVCNKHHKVMSVRFDIHYPQDYFASGDNKDISRTMAKMIQEYRRDGLDPHYMWCREQERSHNPHYHCVLFLNGSKTRNYNHVFNKATKHWEATIGASADGCIYHCTGKENGMLIVTKRDGSRDKFNDNFSDVHFQNSYLAKESGKGERNDGLRDFGMSRTSKMSR